MPQTPDESNRPQVQTGGGAAIGGNVDTGGGDFVGRDKVTIGAQIYNFFKGDTEDARKMRNRQAMLKLVYDTWIRGVLDQSLHGVAALELGLETRPGAVDHPWDMTVQMPAQPIRRFAPGTTITQVFDEAHQSLLILGEPGAGKTTMLLELARDLITRAQHDATQPVPVVFNLSSWAEKRLPLAAWLVVELNSKYNIPKKLAQGWVEQDELLLLLDGLDEVGVAHNRNECVTAINAFRQEHLIGLVICCRSEEHQALTAYLKLKGAVSLLPLTSAEVDNYLAAAGHKLAAVRELLHHDTVLQELAQSPLTLNVMALAYQDKLAAEIQLSGSLKSRRSHLFDTYTDCMFVRPGRTPRVLYTKAQTLHWLTWLAQSMMQHAQTIFLIERLQPSWFQVNAHISLYKSIIRLIVDSGRIEPIERFNWSLRSGLIFGLIGGLLGGLFGVLSGRLSGGLFDRLLGGLNNGLLFGLLFGLSLGLMAGTYNINSVDSLQRSLRIHLNHILTRGLLFGFLFGLLLGFLFGLSFGLLGGFLFGLLFGLSDRLLGEKRLMAAESKTSPNQGIRQSAKYALIIGLSIWLLFGLLGGLLFGLLGGPLFGLSIWLYFGLIGGVIGALIGGGGAALQHALLRLFLWQQGAMPLNYVRFLDYCAERIFLRKVGGGYIFIHRLLLEHFASLSEEDIKRLASPDPPPSSISPPIPP